MDRIFYKSAVSDAYTGYPIYIFDTSYLPVPEEVDYDLFVPALMVLLPEEPYVVVMFSGGLNKINWIWGIKFLRSFLSPDSRNVRNVDDLYMMIAIHESWFVRSLSQIFTNFAFSKWANLNFLSESRRKNLLVSCSTLSDLHTYVDVTTLKLSLNIYVHDAQISMSPDLDLNPVPPLIASVLTTFDSHEYPLFYHHFYQVFHIVNTYAADVELLFHRPGNKLHTAILYSCIMRNQLVWINDWDLNCIASCFKKLLMAVHGPLIDVDLIPIPIGDDLRCTSTTFALLMQQKYANEVLFQILELCHRIIENTATTKHTLSTLLKSLCTVLTHEPVMQDNKVRIAVSLRYFKNLVQHWPTIRLSYKDRFRTVRDIVYNEFSLHETDRLFISYNMTMDDASDDHLEESVSLDTVEALDWTSFSLAIEFEQNLNSDISEDIGGSHSKPAASPSRALSKTQLEPKTDAKARRKQNKKTENIEETEILREETETEKNGNSCDGLGYRNTRKFIDMESNNQSASELRSKAQQSEDSASRIIEKLSLLHISNQTLKKPEVMVQFPPQKYKFQRKEISRRSPVVKQRLTTVKKPVVRGRKVGELARLFEERAEAMHILQGM